ncbi:MAG: hypothetical protein AVDCRST_MAG41-2149, partial [uncultured Corynebacteriales bacterium]
APCGRPASDSRAAARTATTGPRTSAPG